MTYCLEATYIKFIEVDDSTDLDAELDREFDALPIEPKGKCDWALFKCNWEAN